MPQGVRHGGQGVFPALQNGRRPVGDGGVAVNIDPDMLPVAGGRCQGGDFLKEIRCGHRPHAAENTDGFFHKASYLFNDYLHPPGKAGRAPCRGRRQDHQPEGQIAGLIRPVVIAKGDDSYHRQDSQQEIFQNHVRRPVLEPRAAYGSRQGKGNCMGMLAYLFVETRVDGFSLWIILLLCCGVFLAAFMDAIAGGGGIISVPTGVPALQNKGISPMWFLETKKPFVNFVEKSA